MGNALRFDSQCHLVGCKGRERGRGLTLQRQKGLGAQPRAHCPDPLSRLSMPLVEGSIRFQDVFVLPTEGEKFVYNMEDFISLHAHFFCHVSQV